MNSGIGLGPRALRAAWIGIALLSPALPLHAYLAGGGWASLLHSYSLGMFFGLVSYVYFANTLILATRLRHFDRLFGHDRVLVFHGRLAGLALLCAVLHAGFKTAYYGLGPAHVTLGIIGLALFAVVAAMTVLFMTDSPIVQFPGLTRLRAFAARSRRLDYSRLKNLHNLMAAALAVILIHVALAAPTAETTRRLALTGAWGGIALLFYARHTIVRWGLLYRRSMRVVALHRLTPDIIRMTAGGPHPLPPHRAGQFGYIRLLSPACGIEEHPFTLSSAPGSKHLEFTVKILGDYSAALGGVKPGDRLLFDGPYGRFTPIPNAAPYLFLAGGIGITPFLSILADWDRTDLTEPVALIWSARTRADLVDADWLNDLAARHPAISFTPVLTRESPETSRRIDRELLAPHITERTEVYLCGPKRFRHDLIHQVRELGVRRRAIHFESFGF